MYTVQQSAKQENKDMDPDVRHYRASTATFILMTRYPRNNMLPRGHSEARRRQNGFPSPDPFASGSADWGTA